jgi:hypothetical protein
MIEWYEQVLYMDDSRIALRSSKNIKITIDETKD